MAIKKMTKRDKLSYIIADAAEYASRPISPLEIRVQYLADFILVLTKGTKYEGDGKDILEAIGVELVK